MVCIRWIKGNDCHTFSANYLSQSVSTTGVGCFVNLSCRLELVATLTYAGELLNIAWNSFQTYIVLGVVKSMGGEEKVVKTIPVKGVKRWHSS